MKERIEKFLAAAIDVKTRDITELKAIYVAIGKKVSKCESSDCINKMITAVQKHYELTYKPVEPAKEAQKPLRLKPGNHAFAPGGPAVHNNDNTSEKDLKHYLKQYPHISKQLI